MSPLFIKLKAIQDSTELSDHINERLGLIIPPSQVLAISPETFQEFLKTFSLYQYPTILATQVSHDPYFDVEFQGKEDKIICKFMNTGDGSHNLLSDVDPSVPSKFFVKVVPDELPTGMYIEQCLKDVNITGSLAMLLRRLADYQLFGQTINSLITIVPEGSPILPSIDEMIMDQRIGLETAAQTHLQKFQVINQTLQQDIANTGQLISSAKSNFFISKSLLTFTALFTGLGYATKYFFPAVIKNPLFSFLRSTSITPTIAEVGGIVRTYRTATVATNTLLALPNIFEQTAHQLFILGLDIDYSFLDTSYQVFNLFIDL